MRYKPSDEFKEIAEKVVNTGTPHIISPKKLIEYFGAKVRKTHVKWCVDRGLEELGVQSVPDYKSEYLHGIIKIQKSSKNHEQEDFIQRLKLLESANRAPVSVSKNDTLQKAMTLMITNDYSQLPVMNSPSSRNIDGIISWQSIGWAIATNNGKTSVLDFMSKEFTVLKYEMPLLEAVHIIKDREFVLIQKKDKSISGLVTITDIANEFFSLAEPFLYLGQIETSIRVLIDGKFSVEELRDVKYGDDERQIESVSDLTFNEYIQLLRKGDNWNKLSLPLDKDVFTKKLEEVRDIRNDVMHFSSEQLDYGQEQRLKVTAKFLKELL